jgi:hypothetical protein
VFLEKYGRPTQVKGKDMFWDGKTSCVSLGAGVGYVATQEYWVYRYERYEGIIKKGVKDL